MDSISNKVKDHDSDACARCMEVETQTQLKTHFVVRKCFADMTLMG